MDFIDGLDVDLESESYHPGSTIVGYVLLSCLTNTKIRGKSYRVWSKSNQGELPKEGFSGRIPPRFLIFHAPFHLYLSASITDVIHHPESFPSPEPLSFQPSFQSVIIVPRFLLSIEYPASIAVLLTYELMYVHSNGVYWTLAELLCNEYFSGVHLIPFMLTAANIF